MLPQYGSEYEANFYEAMTRLKRDFEYQVPFFGGWVRGGTIVDFVDSTPGLPQPICIFVDGPHWHRHKTGQEVEDMLKRRRLERIGYQVKIIEDESATVDGCLKWIREEIA